MLNLDSIIENWKNRQLIKEITNLEHLKFVIKEQKSVYLGIDPTSDSLHLGHLVAIQLLKELAALGCKPILVLGGATAQIGDPSFRSKKRTALNNETIVFNQEKIKRQLAKLLPEATVLNNWTWYQEMFLHKFLKEIGQHFTLHKMLEKKSFSSALASQNLFYSQFSYLLLQAYDFYYLHKNYDCYLQIGGSDQFPNIVSGITLTRKKTSYELPICGVTTNLLTNKKGSKFSKTNQGGIWVDLTKNSPFQIYQFFHNLDDQTAQLWWKIFVNNSFEKMKIEHQKEPQIRVFQKGLFQYFFLWWEGKKQLETFFAKKAMLENWNNLKPEDFFYLENFLPKIVVAKSELDLLNLLIKSQLALSKREARTLLTAKAIKVNNKLFVSNSNFQTWLNAKANCKYLLLERGKKNSFLVVIK